MQACLRASLLELPCHHGIGQRWNGSHGERLRNGFVLSILPPANLHVKGTYSKVQRLGIWG